MREPYFTADIFHVIYSIDSRDNLSADTSTQFRLKPV